MILDAETVCGLIDNNLASLIHTIIIILKFAIPILLIIFGMIDLAKGVISSKEDEIKNGQRLFIKRLIAAVIMFFVVTIVQLLVGLVDDKNSGVWECANLIMNGEVPKSNIEDIEKDELPENTYKDGDEYKSCCESLGGTYNGGLCKNNYGEIISSDEVSRCVLSGG